jgi:hypothetical protein
MVGVCGRAKSFMTKEAKEREKEEGGSDHPLQGMSSMT